jgi:hypothetical protein
MTRGFGLGRRTGRKAALAAFLTMALLGTVFAGTVTGHSNGVWLTCDKGLEVYLFNYKVSEDQEQVNTVSVSIDGKEVDGSPFTFGESFSQTWPVLPATSGHTAKVVVVAWDEETSPGGSFTKELEIGACQKPTDPPTPTPTSSVESETGTPTTHHTPKVTAPSTDAVGTSGPSTPGGLPIVLFGIMGILTVALVVTPTRRRR